MNSTKSHGELLCSGRVIFLAAISEILFHMLFIYVSTLYDFTLKRKWLPFLLTNSYSLFCLGFFCFHFSFLQFLNFRHISCMLFVMTYAYRYPTRFSIRCCSCRVTETRRAPVMEQALLSFRSIGVHHGF
jgi:hypothetical protein